MRRQHDDKPDSLMSASVYTAESSSALYQSHLFVLVAVVVVSTPADFSVEHQTRAVLGHDLYSQCSHACVTVGSPEALADPHFHTLLHVIR